MVAATVATYCPSRIVEHSKSKSTKPRFATRCVTLYNAKDIIAFTLHTERKILSKPNLIPAEGPQSAAGSLGRSTWPAAT